MVKKKTPQVKNSKPRQRVVGEKRRLNLKVDGELSDWVFDYAERHNVTVTQLIVDYFQVLQRQEAASRARDAEQI